MNRVFGRKKAPGPPAPSLGEASTGVGNHMDSMDGEHYLLLGFMFKHEFMSAFYKIPSHGILLHPKRTLLMNYELPWC